MFQFVRGMPDTPPPPRRTLKNPGFLRISIKSLQIVNRIHWPQTCRLCHLLPRQYATTVSEWACAYPVNTAPSCSSSYVACRTSHITHRTSHYSVKHPKHRLQSIITSLSIRKESQKSHRTLLTRYRACCVPHESYRVSSRPLRPPLTR